MLPLIARSVPVLTTLVALADLRSAAGQEVQEPGRSALRVFLDCAPCDFDHLRREVSFVDYVRDRTDAQLHVLVTQQSTGLGGREFTFFFLGQREFQGRQDTLRWSARQDATDDEIRAGLTRTFTLGVVPYAARTGLAEDLSVAYDPAQRGPRTQQGAVDPWNFWVFRAGVNAAFEGESRTSEVSIEGSLAANRTTERVKLDFNLSGEYTEDRFELSDTVEFVSAIREYEAEALLVWSLGPHWSAGVTAAAESSTRINQDIGANVRGAIEYNIYPYTESTRRAIRLLYTVGPAYYNYRELTLFEQLSEARLEQEFEISAGFQQPWGEVDGSLEWSNFLHDFSLHRIDLFAGVEVRLFRGLNLDVRSNVARIKNQIYVPLEDVPPEEILLRRRELGTDFEYEVDVGVSFTFGSLFNNVVNPRMRRN